MDVLIGMLRGNHLLKKFEMPRLKIDILIWLNAKRVQKEFMMAFLVTMISLSICAFAFVGFAIYKEEKKHKFRLNHPELVYDEAEIY